MITSDEKRLIESIIKSYEGSVGIQHDLVKNMFAKLLNLEFNNRTRGQVLESLLDEFFDPDKQTHPLVKKVFDNYIEQREVRGKFLDYGIHGTWNPVESKCSKCGHEFNEFGESWRVRKKQQPRNELGIEIGDGDICSICGEYIEKIPNQEDKDIYGCPNMRNHYKYKEKFEDSKSTNSNKLVRGYDIRYDSNGKMIKTGKE